MKREPRTRHVAAIGVVLLVSGCGGGLGDETMDSGTARPGPLPAAASASPSHGSPPSPPAARAPTPADPYARTLVNPRAQPGAAAEYLNGVNLFYESKEEILAAVAAYAAANPRIEVIRGYGWSPDVFDGSVPSALELDTVVRDRPVILLSADLRTAWRNSRAAGLPIAAPSGT